MKKWPTTPKMAEVPLILMCEGPMDGYEEHSPFNDPIGEQLAELCGIDHVRLRDAFELMRVFDRRPIGGVQVPLSLARFVCRQMAPLLQRRNVLFYGRTVCTAFGFEPRRPLQWQGGSYDNKTVHFAFAVIPDLDPDADPDWSSWWRTPEHILETEQFLRPLVHPKARACHAQG
jgi:hypothetical protein